MSSAQPWPDADERVARAQEKQIESVLLLVDADLRIQWCNQGITALLGLLPADVLGTNALDLLHPEDVGVTLTTWTGGPTSELDDAFGVAVPRRVSVVRLLSASGEFRALVTSATNLLEDPDVSAILVWMQDGERSRLGDIALEALLRGAPTDELLERIAELLASELRSPCTIGIESAPPAPRGTIPAPPIRVGDLDALNGRGPGPGTAWEQSIADPDDGVSIGRIAVWSAARDAPSAEEHTALQHSAAIAGLGLARERAIVERELTKDLDALTGLPNRRGFTRLLLNESIRTDRRAPIALMVVDLDDFARTNATHGTSVGDRVLVEVAERLSTALRTNDVVARVGDDEFVVLCRGTTTNFDLGLVAQRTLELVTAPFFVRGHTVPVACSIGAALVADDTVAAWDAAHAELRSAKANGKRRVSFAG